MTAGRQSLAPNKEWYTPPDFLEMVYEVLGNVSLDPCGATNSPVKADTIFIFPNQNGLEETWDYSTIFCNPPYGRDPLSKTSIKDWLRKCSDAWQRGSEVIALVPVAPNTSHWKEYVFPTCSAICFLSDSRFKFIGAGDKGAPMAVSAVYWGSSPEKFANVFGKRGNIMSPFRATNNKKTIDIERQDGYAYVSQ